MLISCIILSNFLSIMKHDKGIIGSSLENNNIWGIRIIGTKKHNKGITGTVLPNYRILPFCNGFWPQNATPKNSVQLPPLNVRRFFLNIFFWPIISSLMLDLLNHFYFTLLCYVAIIITIKGKAVIEVHTYKCSSLSLSHTHTHTTITTTTFTGTKCFSSTIDLWYRYYFVLVLHPYTPLIL